MTQTRQPQMNADERRYGTRKLIPDNQPLSGVQSSVVGTAFLATVFPSAFICVYLRLLFLNPDHNRIGEGDRWQPSVSGGPAPLPGLQGLHNLVR